jgi:deazaflavin-dependent oxidoreductase (nitroreductase family)
MSSMKTSSEFNQKFCVTYRKSSWRFAGRMILLITTTGRKSGLPRTTPVQYEKIGTDYYVGAANGLKSDWVRNIQANPEVILEVKDQKLQATVEIISDGGRIADFLAYRLKRHPVMMRMILKADGCSFNPGKEELLAYAQRLTVVVFQPQ